MTEFFLKGGIMMYPLLIASVTVVAIIIDRFIFFHKMKIDEEALFVKVRDTLRTDGADAAAAYCEEAGGPVAAILRAGLKQYGRSRTRIEESFEKEALIEIPRLKRYLPVLNIIGSVSTLIGFTGTVLGMIKAFNSIATAGTTSPGIVAGGIAEALTTTAAGLIVAIPALVFYYYFSHNVERIVLEAEKASRNLIEIMEA